MLTASLPRIEPATSSVNDARANDTQRLQALRENGAGAMDALVARWQRPLFAFAWRYLHNDADAEDVVIQTFVRLHAQRARLRADTKLPAWLFTTLANLCRNQHRWRRRHPEHCLEGDSPTADSSPPIASSAPSPRASLETAEAGAAVRAAIDLLPHDQKTVVLLHHYERLSYREIAAVVGCSERGIETRLYRARQRLREQLTPLLRELAAG
jgi:RNA polymerase sigma-70 factor (ECF subfamily)